MLCYFLFSPIFPYHTLKLENLNNSCSPKLMHNSKCIRLLKILNPKEFKNFPRFIASPYFNSNKQFLPLYKYLSKHYPNFDAPKLTREIAFKKCFPNKKYSYHIMSNLMSGLATLTEEYLLNIQFQKEQFSKKKTLVKAIGERKDAYDLYEKYHKELVQEVESRTVSDMAYHQELRELNHDFYYHPTTNRQTIGNKAIQGVMDDLDIFYAQTKLLYLLEMKSRAYLFGEEYKLILDEKAMLEKEGYFRETCPICLIYLKILKLYEPTENSKEFEVAKNFFSEQMETIGKRERTIILLHLLNYCIRWMNKGSLEYAKENLQLYKVGLRFHLLMEENRMAEMTFFNIVGTGIKCKEFKWTKKIILEYKYFLDEEEKENATLLSLAALNFAQGKYLLTIDLLINHLFDKPFQIISAKSLLLRTYFEQFLKDESYFELLIAQTHAFEKYIRRCKDLSPEKSTLRLNFAQFTRRLAIGIFEKNIPDSLITTLKSNSYSSKQWLLQKIEITQEGFPVKQKSLPIISS